MRDIVNTNGAEKMSMLEAFVRASLSLAEGKPASEKSVSELVNDIRQDERMRFMQGVRDGGGEIRRMTVVQMDSHGEGTVSLPPGFWTEYEKLSDRATVGLQAAYVGDPIEKAKGRMVTRTSTGQTETRGGAKGSRKSGGSKHLIRDERAMDFKTKIDRKLRKLGREIAAWLNDSPGTRYDVRRCSSCRQFGEPEWVYCPKDGKPMESV